MKEFTKFSHIDQFRQVYKEMLSRAQFVGKDDTGHAIYDNTIIPKPVQFYGTVKLHGTNSSVCECNRERWFQKRSDFVVIDHDNAGFAAFATQKKEAFDKLFGIIYQEFGLKEDHTYCIYGEWFGKGVQKSVAVSELSKRFAIFDVVICNGKEKFHLPPNFIKTLVDPENDIYNVFLFKTYEIEINFERPETAVEELNRLTLEVEEHCPAGQYFGVDGIGEGIVWNHRTEDGMNVYRFKTKGEKHSNTKVKKIGEVVGITPEEIKSINEFVDYSLTQNRLEQGLKEIFGDSEPNQSGIGDFVKWCVSDVMREEADTIAMNKFKVKFVVNALNSKARNFIMEELKKI